jgi:hypothetical protein
MDPAMLMAITAGLDILGGERANIQQTASAREQMQFQERMSSTAYQRAMQDMREAGLNPMLAAKVGAASTPAGAMPAIRNVLGEAVGRMSSAAQAARTPSQVKLTEEQTVVAKNTGEKIGQEVLNARTQGDVIAQTVRLLKAQIDQVGVQTALSRENIKLIAQQIKKTKAEAIIMSIDALSTQKIDELAAGGNSAMQLLGLLIRALK